MLKVNFAYIDLSPTLTNCFENETHPVFVSVLNEHYDRLGLGSILEGFKLTLYIQTSLDYSELRVKGPSKSKKYSVVEYSISLPVGIKDLHEYVDFVWEGIAIVFDKYKIDRNKVQLLKEECLYELELL